MKTFLALLAVFLVFSCVAGSVRKSSSRERSTTTSRHQERRRMLQTNRVPTRRGQIQVRMDVCGECKEVVGKVDSIIRDPAKMEQLKTYLNLACDMAPSSYRDECKELVGEATSIAAEIEPFIRNPTAFCQEVGMCGRGRNATAPRHSKLMYLFLLSAKKAVNKVENPRAANDLFCDECKMAISEVKTLVDDKQIQDEAKAELHQVCNMLGSMKDECDSLVNQFFPALIAELEDLLKDPQSVCAQLGMCQSRRMAMSGILLTPARRRSPNQSRGLSKLDQFKLMLSRLHTRNGMNVGCVMCKFGIGSLARASRQNPQVLNGLTRAVQAACNVLPQRGVRPNCRTFVRLYVRPALILALEQLDSQQICDEFKLCSEHELREIRNNRRVPTWRNEVVCESCRLLAQFLKYECRQRSFQQDLANELKHLCDIVPGRFSTQCDNLMDQYVPYAVQMITQDLDPNTICPELRMCPATATGGETEIEGTENNEVDTEEQTQEEEQQTTLDEEEDDDEDLQDIQD